MSRKFIASEQLSQVIIKTYTSGLSIRSTRDMLRSMDIEIPEASIHSVLKSACVIRNTRQIKGVRAKPVYKNLKQCTHCNMTFNQLFARHVFCNDCVPNGKFSKYIRKYGIGHREYNALLEPQNCKCAICDKGLDQGKDTHVDHDHKTGRVRGLLCNVCNTRVGILDNETFMYKAKLYLSDVNRNGVDVKY